MLEIEPLDYLYPLILNRSLVKALGYHATAVLQTICEEFWHDPIKQRTLYFTVSIKHIMNSTYLSADELVEALDKLRDEDIIKLNPEQPITDDNELYLSINEEAFEI